MKNGTRLCLAGLWPSLQLYGGGQMCTLHLSVPLGTAVGKYRTDCQLRAVIFMCASLRALIMYYSANLPLSAG